MAKNIHQAINYMTHKYSDRKGIRPYIAEKLGPYKLIHKYFIYSCLMCVLNLCYFLLNTLPQ